MNFIYIYRERDIFIYVLKIYNREKKAEDLNLWQFLLLIGKLGSLCFVVVGFFFFFSMCELLDAICYTMTVFVRHC